MRKVAHVIHKATYNVREHGAAYLVRKLAHEIWKEITKGGKHLFYNDIDNLLNEHFSMSGDLEVERFRSKTDIPMTYLNDLKGFVEKKYMKEETSRLYLNKLLDIFQDGGELVVGRLDGKIVAYMWKMHGSDHYKPYFNLFPLLPKDEFIFGALVLPEYRGLGIIPKLIRHTFLLIKEEGAERVFATCKEWNHSSRRCVLKMGMQYISTARSIGIMGKRIIIWFHRKETTY